VQSPSEIAAHSTPAIVSVRTRDSLGTGLRCFFPGASTAPPLRPLLPLVALTPLVADALTLDATFPFYGIFGASHCPHARE
jgi:hypothetical protein